LLELRISSELVEGLLRARDRRDRSEGGNAMLHAYEIDPAGPSLPPGAILHGATYDAFSSELVLVFTEPGAVTGPVKFMPRYRQIAIANEFRRFVEHCGREANPAELRRAIEFLAECGAPVDLGHSETSWLIECTQCDVMPLWWAGKQEGTSELWTEDAYQAVRFSREKDARAALLALPDAKLARVTEHLWL